MTIRVARQTDAPELTRLLQRAYYTHLHADWHLPADWLATPGFLVREEDGRLVSCFAAGADPRPASWVRVVALPFSGDPLVELQHFLTLLRPRLLAQGSTELAWLLHSDWPQEWPSLLGFGEKPVTWVETLVKKGLDIPPITGQYDGPIRSVAEADFPELAAIEAGAFAPMWRHSLAGLRAARGQSVYFTVALLEERPVGFQYSTRGQEGIHLARLTVSNAHQGLGIGSALLADALRYYWRLGVSRVTLNTQVENFASHRLYQKFGFDRAGYRLPVWRLDLAD